MKSSEKNWNFIFFRVQKKSISVYASYTVREAKNREYLTNKGFLKCEPNVSNTFLIVFFLLLDDLVIIQKFQKKYISRFDEN